jgi:hypothetical protein
VESLRFQRGSEKFLLFGENNLTKTQEKNTKRNFSISEKKPLPLTGNFYEL